MITPGASMVGNSAIPAIAPMRPGPNAWRRHPGGGSCIAILTGASCSRGSRPCSSRMSSHVGGTAGITEIRLQGNLRFPRPFAQAKCVGRIEVADDAFRLRSSSYGGSNPPLAGILLPRFTVTD
jgi:hypothetical protein